MEGGDRELVVGPEAAGERLDVFLAGEAGSRAAAQRLIDAGLRARRRRPRSRSGTPWRAGERVTVRAAPATAEPQVPEAQFRVAYEDDHLLIVDKPAGVVVHPARGHRAGTLAQALAGRVAGGDDPDRTGIVHRLDRDTSGLLVARAHRGGARRAAGDAGGPPDHARVPGAGRGPPGGARRHDRRAARPRPARAHADVDRHRRRRATRSRTSRPSRRTRATRSCGCALETGRTHQIRAHLKAIGHPVAGDPEYGTRRARSAWSASSCTPRGSRSSHPVTERRSTSDRRSRATWTPRWYGRNAGPSTGGRGREGGPART